jgi:hypothetical protein
MKRISINYYWISLLLSFLFLLLQNMSFAAGSSIAESGEWYQQPWAWVFGGMISFVAFLLLLSWAGSKHFDARK